MTCELADKIHFLIDKHNCERYIRTHLGPIAQRQSARLITGWLQVRILLGP